MIRLLALAALATAVLACPAPADEPKAEPTVSLSGDIKDEALQKAVPANGVIASQKSWDKLVKAWDIKDAPKVDFAKEFLIVGTWRGSTFNIRQMVEDGNLTFSMFGTKDLRPGFRWKIVSVKRAGVKTVQGKELPKE